MHIYIYDCSSRIFTNPSRCESHGYIAFPLISLAPPLNDDLKPAVDVPRSPAGSKEAPSGGPRPSRANRSLASSRSFGRNGPCSPLLTCSHLASSIICPTNILATAPTAIAVVSLIVPFPCFALRVRRSVGAARSVTSSRTTSRSNRLRFHAWYRFSCSGVNRSTGTIPAS